MCLSLFHLHLSNERCCTGKKSGRNSEESNAIISEEDSFLYCHLQSDVDISALHPYPNQALLFFVCTHLLIFKDFSIVYSKVCKLLIAALELWNCCAGKRSEQGILVLGLSQVTNRFSYFLSPALFPSLPYQSKFKHFLKKPLGSKFLFKTCLWDFGHGPVAKNLPANAGVTGLNPCSRKIPRASRQLIPVHPNY